MEAKRGHVVSTDTGKSCVGSMGSIVLFFEETGVTHRAHLHSRQLQSHTLCREYVCDIVTAEIGLSMWS